MPELTMEQSSLPTYAALHKALSTTALKLNPSQAHGLMTGLLCGNPQHSTAWEELVTGKASADATHEILQAVYDESSRQLKEYLFEFELILPDDAVVLPERAEALTLWCQGFLTGLKLTQVQLVEREPSEMTEAINDLIEVAKMNYEEVVPSEEDESAYADLVEFVRMAVILIYEDLRESEAPGRSTVSNHLH